MKQFRKLNFIVEYVFGYVLQFIHPTISCLLRLEVSLLTKLQFFFFIVFDFLRLDKIVGIKGLSDF